MVFRLFGVCWVMLMSVVELFACWQGRFGRHRNGDIWMVVPHCLKWCIWKERNNRCFESNGRSMPDLKLLFFRTLLDWFLVWRNHHFSSILDFLDLCNFCIWCVHPCILPVYLGVSRFLISIIQKKKKIVLMSSLDFHLVFYCSTKKTIKIKIKIKSLLLVSFWLFLCIFIEYNGCDVFVTYQLISSMYPKKMNSHSYHTLYF